MDREQAAQEFLDEICPLLKRTDYRCDVTPYIWQQNLEKRTVDEAYKQCVDDFLDEGMTQTEIDTATHDFLVSWEIMAQPEEVEQFKNQTRNIQSE